MPQGNMEDWKKAGVIAARALQFGKSLIVPGARAVEVLDKIEEKIRELGGDMAFPAQISCDHIAAHWCADPDDPLVFSDQVVCLDVGVHVNGCIGDTAGTVDLSGRYLKLVEATDKALETAISLVRPGVPVREIGKSIKEVITSHGFNPIHNLGGHGLDLYTVHTSPFIPNFGNTDDTVLEEGQIIAIEPFATDGAGIIYETDRANIFAFAARRPVRSPIARELLKRIERYKGLPFTTRWLARDMPLVKVNYGLKELLSMGVIRKYPPLPDKNKGIVSQSEHTVLVKDEPEILTKPL